MRIQSTPLVLCLFLVLLSVTAHTSAKGFAEENSYKTLISNDIAQERTSKKEVKEISSTLSTVRKSIADVSKTKNAFPKENKKNNSVFSYKNNEVISGKIESSTQNHALHSIATFEKSSFLNGLFYGVSLMILFLNLICYFIFSEKAFLYFSISLSAFALLFTFNDNLLAYFSENSIVASYLLQSAVLFSITVANLVFSIKYLNLTNIIPPIKKIAVGVSILMAMFLLGGALFQDPSMYIFANIIALVCHIGLFIAGLSLFYKKTYSKFYVLASFIPILLIFDFFVMKQIGVQFLASDMIHLKIAVLLQSVIMTYAIVYRMKSIKEENELKMVEMRIFMKKQEMLNRERIEHLMEDVYLENLIMHYDLDGLEIKLLQYISEGKKNEKIAKKLRLSEKELEEVTAELYEKLEIAEEVREDHRMLEAQPDYIYN